YGSDHHRVADTLALLALVLYASGQQGQADSVTRRALEIYETNWGADHPAIADCLTNIATLLEASNRLAEAEQPRRRALEILLKHSRVVNGFNTNLKVAVNN